MNLRHILLALPLALVLPATAEAAKTATMKLAAGKGGPYQKDETGKDYAGPGTEQPTTAWMLHKDKNTVDVVTVWMSSDVSNADRPWQGKCSVLELGPTGDPKLLVDQKQITSLGDANNADERPFNHPHLVRVEGAKNKKQLFLLTYGSDDNNGNVQTYAVLMDHQCNLVSDMVRISNDANNNEGAPEAVFLGDKGWVVAGYYDNNAQRTYAIPLMIDDTDPNKPKVVKLDTPKTIVTPANIGRPSLMAVSNNRALLCAAKGNNRPPEVGVECAYLALDTNGKLSILWKELVDASDPKQGIYYNQPTVRSCGDQTACLLTLRSNGNGKKTNDKGKTSTMFSVVALSDTSAQIKSKREGVGLNQTHTGLCSGQYGQGAQLRAVVYDAPITGAGQPGAQLVSYDPVTKKISFDTQKEYYTVGFVADSGRLANLYGQNPNVQGRDFMRCIGDIPNPAWNQTGGWQNDVQTFFAFPHSGRLKKTDDEPKNALYLTLLPGVTKAPFLPEPPVDIHQVSTSADPNNGPSDPGTETTTGSGGTSTNPLLHDPQAGSGCSAAPGRAHGSLALLSLLAIAMVALRRRQP